MDVQMPELDGIVATKQIRESNIAESNHIPVIALTAGTMKEEKEKCLNAGMDDFLTKPIEAEILHLVLTKYLSHS